MCSRVLAYIICNFSFLNGFLTVHRTKNDQTSTNLKRDFPQRGVWKLEFYHIFHIFFFWGGHRWVLNMKINLGKVYLIFEKNFNLFSIFFTSWAVLVDIFIHRRPKTIQNQPKSAYIQIKIHDFFEILCVREVLGDLWI